MRAIAQFVVLVEAIRRCAVARGDSDVNRDALIAESAGLTRDQQLEMTEHFNEQTAIFSAANGRGAE